ncbi:steroid receptor RNA activator 1 [Gadus chalcogrammus]|uniref:steroid receptor RNA activator 1 n=1 Tax=Gadus chalcogrammus TaxID=1042646 RepID=UPI0024C40079|nr:steroid receptor RNA activator 1 [Gadus chalcogrammus]
MDDLFVKPGNQERGWNDPPQFSYGLQVAGSTRSPLTKRGPPPPAAGLQAPPPCGDPSPDQQATSPHLHGITPPPHTMTTPPHRITPPPSGVTPPPSQATSSPCGSRLPPPPKGGPCPMSRPPSGPDSKAPCGPRAEPDPQPEPDLQAVSSVLAEALEACRQNVSRQVCEDIAKRLRLLEDSWTSGRLSSTVKRRMNALTLEMRSSHWSAADDIHRSLMVDHVTEVSQWMVGIKRLIAETRNLSPELLTFSPADPVQPEPVGN